MEEPMAVYVRTFALLRCCDCEHTFAAQLPPLHVELDECPLCKSGPVQLVELLESEQLGH
jgi:hypothetical protein